MRGDTPARTSPAAEGEAVYWFGHTSGATPHLVPLCAVKAGQAACSTTLGDHAGTGCAERFFLRGGVVCTAVLWQWCCSGAAVVLQWYCSSTVLWYYVWYCVWYYVVWQVGTWWVRRHHRRGKAGRTSGSVILPELHRILFHFAQ